VSNFLVSVARRALVAYVICDLLARLGLDPGVTPLQFFGLFIVAWLAVNEWIPNYKLSEKIEKIECLASDRNIVLHVTRFCVVGLLYATVRFAIWLAR